MTINDNASQQGIASATEDGQKGPTDLWSSKVWDNLSNMKACQLPLRRLSISKGIPETHQFNHRYPKWNVWFQAPGYWRFCGTQNVALHCGGYRSNKRTG